jgi:hypothetical protein
MPRSRISARGDEAVLHFPYLAVADAAHRRQVERQRVLLAQHRHFVLQPGFQHRVEALGDARVQDAAVRGQQADREEVERRLLLCSFGEQRRHRAASEAIDLERALHALRVGRVQAGGGFRVDLGEFGMDGRPAVRRR